ncbi:hypothetical protein GF339_13730, partial [candidate division KSB3 bacterium]|nr:hypothetical protein [candidate division KSB3 bacterium]MBD3325640.1 hypothetical protein [candidate division KSB3 bacterium]
METLHTLLKFLTRSRSLLLGSMGFLIIITIIVLTPFVLPTDPLDMNYGNILQPPSQE